MVARKNNRIVSPESIAYARSLVDTKGPDAAAREIGVSRGALMNVLAGVPITFGTAAALSLAQMRANSPSPAEPSASSFGPRG